MEYAGLDVLTHNQKLSVQTVAREYEEGIVRERKGSRVRLVLTVSLKSGVPRIFTVDVHVDGAGPSVVARGESRELVEAVRDAFTNIENQLD